MNVVRNSGVAFDADRLFAKASRQSVGGVSSHIVNEEGMIYSRVFSQCIVGAFIFYRNAPSGEMTMAKMDSLARQRLVRM